jgi:hypothetical protein
MSFAYASRDPWLRLVNVGALKNRVSLASIDPSGATRMGVFGAIP